MAQGKTVEMELVKNCKNCARYEANLTKLPGSQRPVAQNLYLDKSFAPGQTMPTKIRVTVEALD